MYNWWWITIAFGVILVLGIILFIVGMIKEYENTILAGLFMSFFAFTIFFGSIITAITEPLDAKKEYKEFVETRTMIEQVYSMDYTKLENAGLNNAIIEVNKWLAKAKASKKQWGNWSKYCYLDLDSLDYIVLKKVENGGE